MTSITANMIKELRERTGVGMGKCKEALQEAKGDMEQAIANLRKAGMASAVKKQGREAKEGLIGVAQNAERLAIVEVNAETDFVVKNEQFQQFFQNIAEEVVSSNPENLEAFLQQPYSKEPSMSIDQYRSSLVQMIGENIQIRRLKIVQKTANQSVGIYSHMGGKILCLAKIEGSPSEEALAKEIAMHCAAAAPEYLSPEQIPDEILVHEREIAKSQIKNKPEHIIDKIVEGKLNAYYDTACLLRQKYIKDDSLTIAQLVSQRAKETGTPLSLVSFTRWCVGEKQRL